jgi:hypothetical protein
VVITGLEVARCGVAEGAKCVSQMVSHDGSYADLDSVQRLKEKQAQTAVEFVQVDNLIESCTPSEVVGIRNTKGNEISTQPVMPASLEPLDCSGGVVTIEAPGGQQGQLLPV